jgi:hypothetical protein
MWPHIDLELRTRQLHNNPSNGPIPPSCSHFLSPISPTWTPQLGALVRYVVFIVNVVVGTTLPLSR